MSADEIAFFIGFFGSIHCIGMCGPLALALPGNHSTLLGLLWDKLIYNLGRIITYTLLGLVVGLLGKQLWLAGVQQGISIASGIFVLAAALYRLNKHSMFNGSIVKLFISPFNQIISYALKHKAGHLIVGMLNGLLPCGFVYLALIGAVNTSSVMASGRFMFLFGAGTLPLMFIAAAGSQFFTQSLRRRLNRAVPYFMLFLGVWFIIRGLGMDIPYLSPNIRTNPVICR